MHWRRYTKQTRHFTAHHQFVTVFYNIFTHIVHFKVKVRCKPLIGIVGNATIILSFNFLQVLGTSAPETCTKTQIYHFSLFFHPKINIKILQVDVQLLKALKIVVVCLVTTRQKLLRPGLSPAVSGNHTIKLLVPTRANHPAVIATL